MKNQMAINTTKGPTLNSRGQGDFSGAQRLLKILVVGRNSGVELILGRGFQVAVQLSALDRGILHQPGLRLIEQIGVGDLRVFPHARAALHYSPQHHQADEDEDPEHDRFDSRIHQDPSFPAGGSSR
jgi:hypothetical protein